MAARGEGGVSKFSDSLGSEDLCDLACQPCQLDGKLQEAVGMCTDCQEYLCKKCFDGHTLPRPCRNHELLTKEQMLKSQVSLQRQDKCTEKCAVHEDEVIKYYCIKHSQLGCSVCITLDHRKCDKVRYIPQVVKDLAKNDEYKQAESQLISVVERSYKVTEEYKQKTETLEKDCSEAVRIVKEFKKEINQALDKIEADLVTKCKRLKSEEMEKITQIVNQCKAAQTELQALVALKETYQNNKQNCSLYTVVMKTKDKVKLIEDKIQMAEKQQSPINSHIQFVSNNETLSIMKQPEALGKLSKFGTSSLMRPEGVTTTAGKAKSATTVKQKETRTIVKAVYVQDINVKCSSDKKTCYVNGLVGLPDNRLLIVDSIAFDYHDCGNGMIKLMDMQHGKVITHLTLSSFPFNAAMINNSQVAVTLPNDEKVAIVSVSGSTMSVDRTLDVDGICYGVDHRDGKLAVSFGYPDKVQVLTLQGQVLYTITKQEQKLLNCPTDLAFGQDTTSLYVSNSASDSVMHVKSNGIALGTYTDNELKGPGALFTDSSGNVYVCGFRSQNIHQITPDCKKIQILLAEAEGLCRPCCVGYIESERRLYIGMDNYDIVKVYSVTLKLSKLEISSQHYLL